MKYQLSPEVYKYLRKLNVRVRNSFWDKLKVFEKNPDDSVLDNHALKRNLLGFRSIDITDDNKYVAIYEAIDDGNDIIAYFIQIGLKKELYN